jgi:hypothetical protein
MTPRASTIILALALAACGGGGQHPPPDNVGSPAGSVPFGAAAFSADGLKYAREIEPRNTGMVGVFRKADNFLIVSFDARLDPAPNDLKGLAWHPNSSILAVMYHAERIGGVTGQVIGQLSLVTFYDVRTGDLIKEENFDGFYHFIRFLSDGRLVLDAVGLPELVVDPGLDGA